MHYIFFILVSLIGAGIHLFLSKKPLKTKKIIEVFLLYLLVINIGITGLIAFMGHAFMADQIARSIGWPTGSPFQFEIAVANLAFGVLGILCIWWRGGFWLATGLGHGVFSFGAAYGHIRDIIIHKNFAVNNAGPILWVGDIALPLLIIGLLIAYNLLEKKKRRK